MARSCNVLCRITRKIDKKKMNNKKKKYSSCSKIKTRKNTCWDDQQQDAEYDQPLQGRMSYDDQHQMMMMMNTSVLDNNQSSMWQQQLPDQDAEDDKLLQGIRMPYDDDHQTSTRQQQPVQSEAGVTGGLPILIDIDDIDAKMNTLALLDHKQSSTWQQQQPDQDAADTLLILIESIEKDIGAFAQDLDDMLLDNTTTTTSNTSNGDEDLSSQQQQQQPPAPTSEGEGNLSFLSLDFQFDDYPEINNLYSSSLGFQFDDPLDIDALIQSCCV